jgi:hypothetical protein
MLTYPFILETSRAVLRLSSAIRGRVFLAPFMASELSSPNLQQLISDTLSGSMQKVYPLSLMLPPMLRGDISEGTWRDYTIQQLFLKQEGRTSKGNIQNPAPAINQSMHTIPQNYIEALRKATGDDPEFLKVFRVSEAVGQSLVPVTRLGSDKLNGVMLTYTISLFEPCTLEDYPDGLETIVLPSGDMHPVHPM